MEKWQYKCMESLIAERHALIAEINRAFAGVSRQGGISWRGSQVKDFSGDESYADWVDKDQRWQDLLDDPEWWPAPGIGGFSFLDPIGFRYFLPAAMIYCLGTGYDEGILFHLDLPAAGEMRNYRLGQMSLLDLDQKRAVRLFLEYMNKLSEKYATDDTERWLQAIYSYWFRF